MEASSWDPPEPMVAMAELPEPQALNPGVLNPTTALATVTAAGNVYVWKLAADGLAVGAPFAGGGSLSMRSWQSSASEEQAHHTSINITLQVSAKAHVTLPGVPCAAVEVDSPSMVVCSYCTAGPADIVLAVDSRSSPQCLGNCPANRRNY